MSNPREEFEKAADTAKDHAVATGHSILASDLTGRAIGFACSQCDEAWRVNLLVEEGSVFSDLLSTPYPNAVERRVRANEINKWARVRREQPGRPHAWRIETLNVPGIGPEQVWTCPGCGASGGMGTQGWPGSPFLPGFGHEWGALPVDCEEARLRAAKLREDASAKTERPPTSPGSFSGSWVEEAESQLASGAEEVDADTVRGLLGELKQARQAPAPVAPSPFRELALEFVPHCIAHPLLFLFPKAAWADRFHDWTGEVLDKPEP